MLLLLLNLFSCKSISSQSLLKKKSVASQEMQPESKQLVPKAILKSSEMASVQMKGTALGSRASLFNSLPMTLPVRIQIEKDQILKQNGKPQHLMRELGIDDETELTGADFEEFGGGVAGGNLVSSISVPKMTEKTQQAGLLDGIKRAAREDTRRDSQISSNLTSRKLLFDYEDEEDMAIKVNFKERLMKLNFNLRGKTNWNSLTGKMARNRVNQLTEAIEKQMSGKSHSDTQCILVRSHMQALPGYSPIKTSFFSITPDYRGTRTRSFRTFAMDILMEWDVTIYEVDDNMIAKLRKEKLQYFNTYIKVDNVCSDEQTDQINEIIEQYEILQKKYNENEKKLIKAREMEKQLLKKINNIANQLKDEDGMYNDLIEEIEAFEEEISQVKASEKLEDLTLTNTDVFKKFGIMNKFVDLKKQLFLGETFDEKMEMIEILEKGVKNSTLKKRKKKIKLFNNLETNINIVKKSIDRKVYDIKKGIVDVLTQHTKKQLEKLNNMGNIDDYKNNYLKLLQVKKNLWKLEQEDMDMQTIADELEDQVKRGGGGVSQNTDFIISDLEVDDIQKNYDNLKMVLESGGRVIKPEMSKESQVMQKILAQNGKTDESLKNAKTKSQLHTLGGVHSIIDDNLEDLINEGLTNKIKRFRSVPKNMIKVYKDVEDKISKNMKIGEILFEKEKKRLELAKSIRDKEFLLDQRLGKMFGIVYRTDKHQKCFSDTLLIYHIFIMAKTNIIFKLDAFMRGFLFELMKMDRDDVERLIVLVYSLISDSEFANKIAVKLKEDSDENVYLSKQIVVFGNNMALVVDGYKDLAGYSQGLVYKKKDSFMARLLSGFMKTVTTSIQDTMNRLSEE